MSPLEYNIVAALALGCSLIIGVGKGWHKGGLNELLAFLVWYGFCFLSTLIGFWLVKTILSLL